MMELLKPIQSAASRMLRTRFPFLFWPVQRYRDVVTRPDDVLKGQLQAANYGLRLQRYWWAACMIKDEAVRLGRPMVVVDLGCECGWLRCFTGDHDNIRWIGLDGNIDHPPLKTAGYDELISCNFHDPLPLPDGTADVVVSLHVFEHLRTPASTAAEVGRLLKPGGVFLAGTPVSASPVAALRTLWLKARDRIGRNRHWGHLRKFSPARWSRLCSQAGLHLEFLTGSHLIRCTGSRLENHRWWIRLNQLWAGLFPSLGTEAYLAARKPAAQPAMVSVGWLNWIWLRLDWAVPPAAALAFAALAITAGPGSPHAGRLSDHLATQQDGNDVFYWCPLSLPPSYLNPTDLPALSELTAAPTVRLRYETTGRDLHLIVRADVANVYLESVDAGIRVANEFESDKQRFLLLSFENHDTPLATYLSHTGT